MQAPFDEFQLHEKKSRDPADYFSKSDKSFADLICFTEGYFCQNETEKMGGRQPNAAAFRESTTIRSQVVLDVSPLKKKPKSSKPKAKDAQIEVSGSRDGRDIDRILSAVGSRADDVKKHVDKKFAALSSEQAKYFKELQKSIEDVKLLQQSLVSQQQSVSVQISSLSTANAEAHGITQAAVSSTSGNMAASLAGTAEILAEIARMQSKTMDIMRHSASRSVREPPQRRRKQSHYSGWSSGDLSGDEGEDFDHSRERSVHRWVQNLSDKVELSMLRKHQK